MKKTTRPTAHLDPVDITAKLVMYAIEAAQADPAHAEDIARETAQSIIGGMRDALLTVLKDIAGTATATKRPPKKERK